jgi:uncharacterized membrane protein YdjX (TVP38/TMEM64 family)
VKTRRALLFAILLAAVALAALFLPVEETLVALQSWVESNPSWAIIVVTASITVGTLLLLPLSLMMMLSGLLFGLLKGFIVVWVAGLLASSAAFWIGRTVARPWIERKIKRKAIFTSIDRAIHRKGFVVVLLTRLVILIPYPLLNYSLGLTSVKFRDSLLATSLGAIPAFFLFVYLGTTVSNIAAIMSGDISLDQGEMITAVIALTVVVTVVLLIVRVAGKTLKEELLAAQK